LGVEDGPQVGDAVPAEVMVELPRRQEGSTLQCFHTNARRASGVHSFPKPLEKTPPALCGFHDFAGRAGCASSELADRPKM
jgi:hypothetical protein